MHTRTTPVAALVATPSFWAAVEAVRLRRVCGWCQLVMDEGSPNAATSHGMCEPCSKRFCAGEK